TGVATSFLSRFKLYLNLFIGALLISVVAIFVASKPKTDDAFIHSEVKPVTYDSDVFKLTELTTPSNHENDLPLPLEVPTTHQEAPFVTPTPPVIIPQVTSVERNPVLIPLIHPITQFDLYSLDSLAYNFSHEKDYIRNEEGLTTVRRQRHKSQVGIKAQALGMTEFNSQNLINNIGASLFMRKFISERVALQLEVGYNPIAIRPVTYVETYNIFNNFNYTQTDSARITSLKYVSIPAHLHLQMGPRTSVSFGPQLSFLTGLQGNLDRKLVYPAAPSEQNPTLEQIRVTNRGGFAKTDFGLSMELNYHIRRLELGLKVQQGLTDYTHDAVSPSTHRISSLQLKAAWILGR
ncbi:MAG: outer membrane beta-barrel protein, partial [Bacteroidia bacterium]|nr:outer membrane beta-barrel protein [Bacteroidia bacterium]